MVAPNRIQDQISDALIKAAREGHDKIAAIMIDERLTPEERIEGKEAMEQLIAEVLESAERWRTS